MSSIRECRFFHCACNPDVPANPRAGGEQRHSARRSSWRKIATHKGTAGAATLHPRHGVPAIYEWREFPAAGGLISYGANAEGSYRNVGVYAGRILKGEKPADLPIQIATKFELVIRCVEAGEGVQGR